MAAGGSAPELFTSFIGVFISNSNVGFGTIVGSAVFNVLFVIGMCALLSQNPKNPEDNTLTLTAWPLFRDSLYYSFTLLVLVIAFVDNSIAWYESLIMFVTYIGYIAIMFHNEQAAAKVEHWQASGTRAHVSAPYPSATRQTTSPFVSVTTHSRPVSAMPHRTGGAGSGAVHNDWPSGEMASTLFS